MISIEAGGRANRGTIESRFSRGPDDALKKTVKATTIDGPKSPRIEMLEMFPVPYPPDLVGESFKSMFPVK
jgi:hypothetical protein